MAEKFWMVERPDSVRGDQWWVVFVHPDKGAADRRFHDLKQAGAVVRLVECKVIRKAAPHV